METEKETSNNKVILFILFITPLTAEVLTGSTPILLFLRPIVLLIFIFFYGSAALISRELIIRWKTGFNGLFLLGTGFGILMEGIAVKSFFDPNWPDLNILGIYGRCCGVNWVWMVNLMFFHAFLSIVIPIALTNMMFPDKRNVKLIGRKGFIVFGGLLIISVLLVSLIFTQYRISVWLYLIMIFIILLLAFGAKKIKTKNNVNEKTKNAKNLFLWLMGFFWVITYWVNYYLLPLTGVTPLIPIIFGLLLVHVLYRFFNTYWYENNKLYWLVTGILSFYLFMAPISEILHLSGENTAGQTIYAILYLIFLIYLKRKIK